jgi:hypothetical protein
MDPLSRDKATHFRGNPRPGRSVSVSYRAAASGDAVPRITASTRNLGAGGAFVLCPDPLAVGTRVELTLHLPRPRRDIDVMAEVRWRVTESDEPDGAGMGLKFVGLGIDDAIALQEYFASLTGLDTPA